MPIGGISFEALHSAQEDLTRYAKYGQSKLANLLHSRELAKRYPEIICVAVHPGMVLTGLSSASRDQCIMGIITFFIRPLIGVTVEQGVLNQLWAATGQNVVSGLYYVPVAKKNDGSMYSRDAQLAEKLWQWTGKELDSYVL